MVEEDRRPGGMDESAQMHTDSGSPSVNYSVVQGLNVLGGTGNTGNDPLLDPNSRLQSASSAIDAGNNALVSADTLDLDGDGNTAEPTPFDLDGRARFVQDRLTTDTGVGTPPIVDIGAYEFSRDCNNNGVADDVDLTSMSASDCNGNNIPDSCDVTASDTNPMPLPDCNNNGLPDACDLISGVLHDVNPMDGFPDECASAIASGNWDQPGTWDLGLGATDYPNNNPGGTSGIAVTVEGFTVGLNISVTVPTIQVVDGGVINAFVGGGNGNLSVVGAAGLRLTGGMAPAQLIVNSNPVITVSTGSLTLDADGEYRAEGVDVTGCGMLGFPENSRLAARFIAAAQLVPFRVVMNTTDCPNSSANAGSL